MNDRIHDVNSLEFLIKKINENSKWYGKARIRAVLVREKDSIFLYLADVILQHKLDNTNDVFYDYGNAILVSYELVITELLKFIESLSSGIVTIKNIDNVKITGGFDHDCYHIASRNRYAGIYYEWPFWFTNFSANSNVSLMSVYDRLISLGKPPYPDVYEATYVFLKPEYKPNRNNPIGIHFIVPDYRARINTLEIAENQISITTERKEIANENLIAQFYCKKGEKDVYTSSDIEIDPAGVASLTIPFTPDHVQSYLLEKKTGQTIDSKAFGKYYTDRNDGIIVRTSKESVETMLAQGENQYVEFKLDIDREKNEFLETIVAFANTNDGTILLGVDDERRVIGYHDDFEKTDRKIRGLVNGNCEPNIEVNVEQVMIENKPVIVVKVKEGNNKPYLLAGKSAYKRVIKDDYVLKRLDFDNIYSRKNNQRDTISSI